MPLIPAALLSRRLLALVAVLLALPVAPARAQEGEEMEEEAAPVYPGGTGTLEIDGAVAELAFSTPPLGTLFALAPVSAALGAALEVGPLQSSHTLTFGAKKIVVGPSSPVFVVEAAGAPAAIHTLRQTPYLGPTGLQVSLDFLERTFGDELGVGFRWDAATLTLHVERRAQREVGVALNMVHQRRLTIVEVQLTDLPRYRLERSPGELVVRLVGDRFRLPAGGRHESDELVRAVEVTGDRIRLSLAEGAAASEPRVLSGEVTRLVIEIFPQAVVREPFTGAPERPSASRARGVRTIVLDPGHGGVETGAVGTRGSAEKDLTMQVARALQSQLERRLPVRVLLTREGDEDVPLDSRTALGNRHKADLFVSLHLNSSYGAGARGTETYFLSRQASDQLAADAAAAENSGEAPASPEGTLELILWDLAQSYHLAESQRFANLVQEELNQTLGIRDRGVKQAPFRVLMGATMPAVLVELGFLSNPDEEALLQSPVYQAQLVDALVRAVARFRAQVEERGEPAEGAAETPR